MNIKDKNRDVIDEILKDAHEEIEPLDSWEALRARIDGRIDNKRLTSVPVFQAVVFWRRIAFIMAACFVITAGLLVYFFGVKSGMQEYEHLTATNNLLNQADLNRLSFAFSQVRQLFGQQSQWIMIGSDDSTQMGVADKMVSRTDNSKVIILRLAVNLDGTGFSRQYFDVVTFSNQEANFQLPLANTLAVAISLKPILKNNDRIEVEINAQVDGTSGANNISTVVDNNFTSLIRMRANNNWVNIDGIGQAVSKI
jgi:hypothetical protein